MRRYIFYAFMLIALLTLITWGISQFVQPILPSTINSSVILFFAVLLAVVGGIAGFKDVVELFHLLIPQTNSTNKAIQLNNVSNSQGVSLLGAATTLLEKPGSAMNPGSRFYIERSGDFLCRQELQHQGITIVIKAVQQMGKSSLLNRAISFAQQYNKLPVHLDFRLLDSNELNNPTNFYKVFCQWIANELDLPDKIEVFWHKMPYLNNEAICTEYVNQHILSEVNRPVTLAIDEVDRLLNSEFRSNFFAMLRHWHNQRALSQEWSRLDLLLVISTEPYVLIDNLDQSPFNVGMVIRLEDFTFTQTVDLNSRHGKPFSDSQLHQLMGLLGGHPYLTHLAMFLVASGNFDANDLLAKATAQNGPFSEHLEHVAHLVKHPKLAQAMRQVIKHQLCSDRDTFFRLYRAGLVLSDGDRTIPRCGLYEAYLQNKLGL